MLRTVFILTLGAALWAAACGGSQSGPSGSGSVRVMLRDSPYSDARSLLVTFSEISIHRDDTTSTSQNTAGSQNTANSQATDKEDAGDGGEWINVPFAGGASSRTCDLKKLESVQDLLGDASVEPGHYTQIRLHVTSAALYFDNAAGGSACASSIDAPSGRSAPLEIPSGVIKLNRPFEVSSSDTTTLVLDFDGDKSVHQTGNGRYMMQPVIAIVSVD